MHAVSQQSPTGSGGVTKTEKSRSESRTKVTIAQLRKPEYQKPPCFDMHVRVIAISSPEDESKGGKGQKGGKGSKSSKGGKGTKSATKGVATERSMYRCTIWAADESSDTEFAIFWRRHSPPPATMKASWVNLTNVKARPTPETGVAISIDEAGDWAMMLERADLPLEQRRLQTVESWSQQDAWKEAARALVKMYIYVNQQPEIKLTKDGNPYLCVDGVDKTGASFSLKAWSIFENDGAIVSGRKYVAHGLRMRPDKYNEGWVQIDWDRQFSAFEDVATPAFRI